MFTPQQVTALTAQARAAARYNAYAPDGTLLPDWQLDNNNQPIYVGPEIAERGVGLYGQTPAGLTLTGFLKPGALSLITSPELTLTVLNTPLVWTGKLGVNSLLDYLNEPVIQNLAQIEILDGAYQGLIDAGILTGLETARYQATFVQPAARYGVTAVALWVQGQVGEELTDKIKIAARQGQYAIDFVEAYSNVLLSGQELPGFDNTVDRQQIDQAVSEIIGNQKIPTLEFADIVTTAEPIATVDEEGIFRFAPGKPKD